MATKEVIELEVKSDIGDAAKDAGKLTKNLKDAKDKTEDLTKASKDGSGGFRRLGSAVRGVGFALKSAGIGLVVALLAKLGEVFGSNQKVVDKFNTAMSFLSIGFNDLFRFLENNVSTVKGYFKAMFEDPVPSIKRLGTAIKNNMIERFNSALDLMGHLAKTMKKLFAKDFKGAWEQAKLAGEEYLEYLTGVDGIIDKTKKTIATVTGTIVEYTKSTWKQAEAVIASGKAADRAAVEFAKLNAQYLKDAELQRQIRDDVSKTFAVRIKANEDLGKIIKKQHKAQKAALQTQINALQLQYDIADTDENWIALETQKVALLELEETITGQLSEQKTNQIGLEEELRDAKAQTLAEGMTGIELELEELKNSYDEKVRLAEKAGMSITAITKKYEKQKHQIVQAGVTQQLSSYAGLAGALSSLANDNKQLAVAGAIIDTYAAANKVMSDPTMVGPARFVAVATAIAMGLANVKKIMQTDVGDGGGGSAPSDSGTPAPQMIGGKFELGSFDTPDPVQAYVVTDDMTDNQDKLANIRRRATI